MRLLMPESFFLVGRWLRRCCCAAAGWLAACSGPAAPVPAAQWAPDSATVRVAAGPQYARGAGWRLLWGTHYRALWATPVTAPVLRLASACPEGLVPVQAGGSFQSHTLRLVSPSGRQFVLRSVDKDGSAALPAGWRRWLLGGLMKDQTTVTEPYGACVAAELAAAAGVYHVNPRLVFLADDPGLGPFRARYANALYLLEERPEGDQRRRASFGHSAAVGSSARMLTDLRQRPGAQVDARAYLRARLLDLVLGDWSRREDQWRWASFPRPGGVRYRPIPRDRDQAFFRFDDGVVPRLVGWFVPKYQSFHATLGPTAVAGLTRTAQALDRTLLAWLSADDFRQEADSLRRRLDDAAIARALQAGPPETRAAVARCLGPALRARREQLPAAARQFYALLAAEAWVVGTDQAERFVLERAGPGRLRIRTLARRPHQPDSLLTERVYARAETQQVNVYGLGGDDIFEVGPDLKDGIAVRLYDGAGHDVVRSAGPPSGALAAVTWFAGPDGDAHAHGQPLTLPGVTIRPDPDPAPTATGKAWLTRYRLGD